MTDNDFSTVFAQLAIEHRAALLANPSSALPPHLAKQLLAHAYAAYWVNGPDGPRWRLRPSEADGLEDERLRLDQWWQGRSEAEREALIEHRRGPIPAEVCGAVVGADLTGSFTLSPMVAAYLEIVAEGAAQ